MAIKCERKRSYSSPDSVSIEMLARNAQQHSNVASLDQAPPAVHASGFVEVDFEGPWGGAAPFQRLKTVWRRLIPAYLVVFGVYFATAFLFFKYTIPNHFTVALLIIVPDMWYMTMQAT